MSRKDPEQYIQECQEWLARNWARIDQLEKRYEDQYPMVHPRLNEVRMRELDVEKFNMSVHEWELEQYIQGLEEGEDEAPSRS